MKWKWVVWGMVLLVVVAALLASIGADSTEPAPTPSPTVTGTPEPAETEPSVPAGPVEIVIPMPETFSGDLDELYVGIPVEGLPNEIEP